MTLKKRHVDFDVSSIRQKTVFSAPFTKNFLYAYTILVPDSERYIIRCVLPFRSGLSASLRAEINKLFFQESQHAKHHDQVNSWLSCKGWIAKGYGELVYRATYAWVEKLLSPRMNLAVAAATEHLNTVLAEYFLKNLFNLIDEPPLLKALYGWHFAEEIEHKTVVFDILNDRVPGYSYRIGGMIIAGLGFLLFLPLGSIVFAYRDRSLFSLSYWQDWYKQTFNKSRLLRYLARGIRDYFSPSFHPNQRNNDYLIAIGLHIYEENNN